MYFDPIRLHALHYPSKYCTFFNYWKLSIKYKKQNPVLFVFKQEQNLKLGNLESVNVVALNFKDKKQIEKQKICHATIQFFCTSFWFFVGEILLIFELWLRCEQKGKQHVPHKDYLRQMFFLFLFTFLFML